MKKRLLATLLVATMIATVFAGCGKKSESEDKGSADTTDAGYKVAMITDSGDITDQSFNQTTYEACQEFSKANSLDFKYYKPTEDSTDARVAATEQAIDEGYNVIVMPGYLFAATLVECAKEYPDVKFIALDCSKGDLLEAAIGDDYDYNPDNWKLEDYVDMSNIYCAVYQEELSGYMAGYALVKLGYKNLGFMGGMAVPAVMRYGYGFVQGADAAAKEDGADVTIQYAYGGTFGSNNKEVIAACDTMYEKGADLIFACGGSIYKDVCSSAVNAKKEVVGVDVDQAEGIAADYPDLKGKVVTSAMKGLQATVMDTLDDVINNGNWDKYAGQIATLGLVSGDDPTANYCQLAPSTVYNDTFTEDDYKALVSKMFAGDIKVSNDISGDVKEQGSTVNIVDVGTILN